MATFVITSTDNTFEVSKDGEAQTFPKGIFINQTNVLDVNQLTCFNKYKNRIEYQMYTDTDFINVNGATAWSDAEELKTALKNVMFLASSESSVSWGGITGVLSDQTDLYNEIFENRIIVKQSSDFGVIDPLKEYFIDGEIDMTGVSVEIPSGGINIKGYDFNVSKLVCSDNTYTMFTSPVGGSGDVLITDIAIEVTGTGSQVYDIKSDTGFKAFEIDKVNFNNCTSLGKLDNYRQGLETGTGRFGGTPELELVGTWVGGYFVDTSIVRSLTAGSYSLYKAGLGFSMNSRFRSNQNIDLPANTSFFDFSPSNFPNANTVQLDGLIISRGGIFDSNDGLLIPNMDRGEPQAYYKNCVGIQNTYVGSRQKITTELATVVSATSTFYDLNGTFTISDNQHFDSPVNGQLRHLGLNPIEFNIIADLVIDGASNNVVNIRFRKWDDSASVFEDLNTYIRQINSLVGGRDVAFFTILDTVVLNQNDYVYAQISNETSTANLTAELDSYIVLTER